MTGVCFQHPAIILRPAVAIVNSARYGVSMDDSERHDLVWHVAENVRAWRNEKGLTSAAKLSARLAELGVKMERTVLANFETHRRTHLTVEELAALALALAVPPVDLLLPADESEMVEVTPTRAERAAFVRDWLRGDAALPPDPPEDAADFLRKSPEAVRRLHAVWREPALFQLGILRGYLVDALLGPRERVDPDVMAEGLREQAKRLTAYVELLADEVEERGYGEHLRKPDSEGGAPAWLA